MPTRPQAPGAPHVQPCHRRSRNTLQSSEYPSQCTAQPSQAHSLPSAPPTSTLPAHDAPYTPLPQSGPERLEAARTCLTGRGRRTTSHVHARPCLEPKPPRPSPPDPMATLPRQNPHLPTTTRFSTHLRVFSYRLVAKRTDGDATGQSAELVLPRAPRRGHPRPSWPAAPSACQVPRRMSLPRPAAHRSRALLGGTPVRRMMRSPSQEKRGAAGRGRMVVIWPVRTAAAYHTSAAASHAARDSTSSGKGWVA